LANDELLDAVCGTNLCNGLGDLGVPVTTVTTNDEGRALDTFRDGEKDAGDKRLGVVLLLEDLDLLAKTRTDEIVSDWVKGNGASEVGGRQDSRSGLLVLERLEGNSLDSHDVYVWVCESGMEKKRLGGQEREQKYFE
jgi:hypothetical protein